MKAGKYATPEKLRDIRAKLGTDQPMIVQYGQFLKSSVSLDFGRSWSDERPVAELIGSGLGPSLSLTIPAFVLEALIAVSLALFCAFYRGTLIDRLIVVLSVAAMSIP